MPTGEKPNILCCPLCGTPLSALGTSLVCAGERRHTFDFSKDGYVNLNTHLPSSGDTKEMAAARQAFLRKGYYAPLADEAAKAAGGGKLLADAGCGEGYYTEHTAKNFESALGVDLSKYALMLAGKSAKRNGLSDKLVYAVASVYTLPLPSGSCDCVQNIFAPCVGAEFARVLKGGGRLVTAAAGRNHLYELKALLYDTVIPNETRQDYPTELTLEKTVPLTYKAVIASEDVYPLFTMTPYFYRTKKERAERLASCGALEVTLDFEIRIYKKEETDV